MTDQEKEKTARIIRDCFLLKPITDEAWTFCKDGYVKILENICNQLDLIGMEIIKKNKEN